MSRSPLSWLQRYAGINLSSNQQLARLLMLHRLGFEAELAGEFVRADFFWQEAVAQLKSAWPRLDVWRDACAVLGEEAPASPEALRDCIADELFVDTHIAFANGRLNSEPPLSVDDRAFVHLAYLRALLEIRGMPARDSTILLAPGFEAEIAAFQAAKKWDEAIERATLLSATQPDDVALQDRVAVLHFSRAIDGLSKKKNELSAASWLGQKNDALDKVRLEHPDRTITYELLGQLHHLQSIRLANGGRLAEALVAARKAQAFAPGIESIGETISQLVNSMNDLQTQMRDIQDQLRRSGNIRLSADGLRLKAEADRGFGPLEQYVKSGQPEEVAAACNRASALRLWADIGLPQTPPPSEEVALRLLHAVSEVYASPATDIADIAALFRTAAASNPAIAQLAECADRVAAFILQRRLENAGEAPKEEKLAVSDLAPVETAAASSIPAARDVVRPRLEPLRYWLFGTQDRPHRALAIAAGIAAMATLVVAVEDWRGFSVRAQAYKTIIEAQGPERENIVVREARRFLGTWTFQAGDPRDMQVQGLLGDALEAPNRSIRDGAFEQLRLAVQGEDNEAALDAAERFLGAPPLQIADARQKAVLNAYARAFTTWFANLPEPIGEAPQARIRNYRKFASAAPTGGSLP